MKKIVILLVLAAVALPALAQKPEYDFAPHKRLPEYEFKLPDSLAHMVPWQAPVDKSMQPGRTNPAVSMTSVIVLQGQKPPRKVIVTRGGVLQTPHLTVSNGQAWNWGSYPDSYLDARTIILPMPR